MNGCEEYRETLLLDVHGEAIGDRRTWERHLVDCPGCRDARERLRAVIQRVQGSGLYPEPSAREAAELRRSISLAVDKERQRRKRRRALIGLPLPRLPALVAACLLAVSFGWIGLREIYRPAPVPTRTYLELDERLIAKDLEILEALDLLEDMDVIQQLVQAVDTKETAL